MAKQSKPADIRAKTADELSDAAARTCGRTQFNLRFQRATGQNGGRWSVYLQVRRDIARVKTIMAQHKTASAAAKS
jgi:ribosomal protein L29